jgi:hypothetical protein
MENYYKTIRVNALNGFGINIQCAKQKKLYAVEIDGERFVGYRGKTAWRSYGWAVKAFESYLYEQIDNTPHSYSNKWGYKQICPVVNDLINQLVNDGRLVIRELK